jgi:ferrous iron transport protein A
MTLNQLARGKSATILFVNADKELKNRFNSFGLVKGATIFSEASTLANKTIEVRLNKTKIALRSSEAEKIEIAE